MAALIVVLAGVVLWFDVAAIRFHLRRTSPQSTQVVESAGRATSLDDLLDRTTHRLVALFMLRGCWFEQFPFDSALPRIEPGRIVAPEQEPGGPPASYTSIELPIRWDGLTLGRIVMLPSARSVHELSSADARETAIGLAEELASPVAAALRSGDLSSSAR